MPKISYNKSGGGKIIYDKDDWFAGLDKIQTTALTTSKIGDGFARMNRVSPHRSLGHITVAHESIDISNPAEVTGLIKNGVINADNAYLISTDKVHKLGTLTSGTLNTTAPFPHTIDHAHTGEAGSDIVNYFVGATLKAFFSFHDDTDWDVGVYDYTANTFDDDFMSTIPASPMAGANLTDGKDIEHPMIVGDDDVLYMASGRYVHAFDGQDGADGTFYPKVLKLPAGWRITSFAKMPNNKFAIGAYYSSSLGASSYNKGEARVWVWGYNELDIDKSYNLHDNYISELFNWKGTLACFTSGRKTSTVSSQYKLQAFNGLEFETVVQYKDGGLPIHGGVEVLGEDIYWNAGGGIYSYVKNPFTNNFDFNNIAGDNSKTSGMLKIFTDNFYIHISKGIEANNGLQYYGTNYTTGFFYCKNTTLILPTGKKAKIKSLAMTFKEVITAGGRSLALNLNIDGSSKEYVTTFEAVPALKIKYEEKSSGSDFDSFVELQPVFTWGEGAGNTKAPTVEKLEIEFEYVNL